MSGKGEAASSGVKLTRLILYLIMTHAVAQANLKAFTSAQFFV